MADPRLWSSLLLLPIAWLVWTGYRLVSNYAIARRVGVPVVVVPINPESPVWMLTSDFLGPYINHVLSWIPFGSGSFTRYAHRGWDVHDRAKSFLELGDAFILVTTGKNWLYVCNAETFSALLQRRSEFSRPLEIMGKSDNLFFCGLDRLANEAVVAVLDVFGPNLSTACTVVPFITLG